MWAFLIIKLYANYFQLKGNESLKFFREALRDMPQCLAVKKIIKRKFMTSVNGSNKTLGCGKMLKYQIGIWFSRVSSHNCTLLFCSKKYFYFRLKAI